ncbi:hypothetical protein T440DRAFT_559659 [Plenodomus tracheiphilus IPT5]|uniref:Uncharacterized protein n=1 Tax=Plenodomus tracheiphilus IPT5 TaxID=1408161 RepID=A0A6A7AMH5_9PLEO|nr:hypothetical protein T440DRAFT_559659 [Plenodomus tracheiphilus IPT5]
MISYKKKRAKEDIWAKEAETNTDDVAQTHVVSLDRKKVPGNERYILTSQEILDLRSIAADLRAQYPELAKRIPELQKSSEPRRADGFAKVDTSKAEAVFGNQWKSHYDSVKEAVLDVVNWEKENDVK